MKTALLRADSHVAGTVEMKQRFRSYRKTLSKLLFAALFLVTVLCKNALRFRKKKNGLITEQLKNH